MTALLGALSELRAEIKEEKNRKLIPVWVSSPGLTVLPIHLLLFTFQCPQVGVFCILSKIFSCKWERRAFEGLLHLGYP